MLCINDRCDAALFLHLCHGVDSQGCLTGRLRTIDLDDTSFRVAANAQRVVQSQTAGRNHRYVVDLLITQTHDSALAEVLVNFCHCILQRFQLLCRRFVLCHNCIDVFYML